MQVFSRFHIACHLWWHYIVPDSRSSWMPLGIWAFLMGRGQQLRWGIPNTDEVGGVKQIAKLSWPSWVLLSRLPSTAWNRAHLEIGASLGMQGQQRFYILIKLNWVQNNWDIPMVNIVNNHRSMCFTMHFNEIFIDPGHQMVFESTLDKLME